MTERLRPGLATPPEKEIAGEVLFDRFTRGRYATDASIYQIMPTGVVVARTGRRHCRGPCGRARGGRCR